MFDISFYLLFLLIVVRANTVWQSLMVDGDLYKRSAACYFYWKSLSAYGRKAEALEILKKVSADAGGSKYAAFCSDLLTANTPQTAAPVQ